jgi:hypothetical protein
MARGSKNEVAVGHNSYADTRFNAVKHAILSKYTVLPWEDETEYADLLDALVGEHEPEGPTETHLVEELAGILWRKRRLRLAEAAAFQKGLRGTTDSFSNTAASALAHLNAPLPDVDIREAIAATPEDTRSSLADLAQDKAQTKQAIGILRTSKPNAYSEALKALRSDTRSAWEELLEEQEEEHEHREDEDDDRFAANAQGLLRWLERVMCEWYVDYRSELVSREAIRLQAFGEAFDFNKLERLGRYEVHLDRKLERTLTMLIRLHDLRGGSDDR